MINAIVEAETYTGKAMLVLKAEEVGYAAQELRTAFGQLEAS